MIKNNREYRSMVLENRENIVGGADDYVVRGYASTFEPYILFSVDGVDYKEKIDERAFDNADFSDCQFKVNHEGDSIANTRSDTVMISVDAQGLHVEADLSKCEGGRREYEAIKNGIRSRMSFAFVVADGGDTFDRATNTRIINSIDKVYDVSSVDIPANGATYIETVATRSYFDGVIEELRAERLEAENKLRLAKLKYEFLEV